MKPLYLSDPQSFLHDTGNHLEIDSRVRIIDELAVSKYHLNSLPLRDGTKEELYKIHDQSYVDWVESGYENGVRMIISSDTILSQGSYEVAKRAACSTKVVVEAFKSGVSKRAFLNLRPPGHHAEIITGQGFCIFNNIALMAKFAQESGYKNVLIIDFDVHHGNGTQDIFYEDDSVYYFSTHEAHNYPFTGTAGEIGSGRGRGYTKNMPYENFITDREFLKLFEALPKDFKPDIVLVSAGYDLMKDEEISSAQISFDALGKLIDLILKEYENLPIAFLLEGGYNLESLKRSVDITLNKLCASSFC
ncbi:MAG: histone deacetylase [Sulfurospirillum sp.]|nr:MAG: histone deacetylase [Sulfurospirillum sp.]